LVPRDSRPLATPGKGAYSAEATVGWWDPVHARRNGMWRVSAGVLEPLVGLRPFDHAREAKYAAFDPRDGLVLRFGVRVAQGYIWLSRGQKPCVRSWVSVGSVAHWVYRW